MCVMKRLPLTAYRKSGGVASRRRFVRELIEGVVQLDRVEVAHVMLEHLRRLRAGRIVAAQPVFVVIAGRSDANVCHERTSMRNAVTRRRSVPIASYC